MKETSSTSVDQRAAALKLSNVGILFAGTPHRGSDKSQWIATATKLANLLQKDRSTVLLEALKPGNLILKFLQDGFKDILPDFAVYNLLEETPYPRIGKVRYVPLQ